MREAAPPALFIALTLAGCAHATGGMLPGATALSDSARDAHARTTAYGYVYDDPSGKPLGNVPVHLAPWIGCKKTSHRTRECPPDLPYHTLSNARGRFELRNVPNGHYLLIVGSDDVLDFVRATVHDQVWLTGGMQRLAAPTLPRQPRPTQAYPSPHPVPVPAVERSGDYRLATINETLEFPCLDAINHVLAGRHFVPLVLDEWMTENVRTIESYRKTLVPGARVYDTEAIFSGTSVTGGKNCKTALVDPAFTKNGAEKLALDSRSLWYGGEYLPPGTPGQPGPAHGAQLFGPDPRAIQNPANPPWP